MRTSTQGRVVVLAAGTLVVFLTLSMTACGNQNAVTGMKGDKTASATQSETSATTTYDGISRLVVSYNDETADASTITYTSSTRLISAGASNMGWSYSENGGASWTYGGTVSPPTGWAVLWGDPAIGASNAHFNVAFLANLAIPNSKFPAGGISGPVNPSQTQVYLGGACLSKSADGGRTFNNYQCVSNTEALVGYPDSAQGHFYDGGSVVGSYTGEMLAAWVDVYASQIDVYLAKDENSSFKRIAPPFPGMYIGSHPRLRAARDGSVYVAAQGNGDDGNSYVYINRYVNGAWGKPVQASLPTQYYFSMDFGTTVDGSELTLRTGANFSYDVGASSPNNADGIRLLYVGLDVTGHHYIDASVCAADLSSCSHVPLWSTQGALGPGNSPIDFFNPEVAAWPGFIGLPPTWQASWVYHYGNNASVNLSRATLGYFPNSDNPIAIFPVDIIQNTPVCSDSGRGYWGDYDSMIQAGWQGTSSIWMRFLTDSTQGCPTRWFYMAKTQHVQQANYTY